MSSSRIISGLTCGGIKCDVTSGESFMRDTLVRHEHHGHEVRGGCYRGGQRGAAVPTTQCKDVIEGTGRRRSTYNTM